ncbi:MAG TPA: hypothetical protein PKA64_22335, partial [Myxococcota bacterium]|nr:hypothetical protein [Myxococcota bacterium]
MRAVAIVLPLILAACAGGAADKAGPDSSGQTGDTDPGGADDTDSEASDDTDSEASDDTDSEASDDTDAPPAPGTVRGDQAVHGTDDAEALAGVTVIEGALDLTCYGAADLSALAGLTEVTGDLTLDCPDLDDLSALSALTRVGGTLSVRRAPRSRNLTGLGALASIGRDLTLCAPYGRGSVTSPRGVGALASIGGQLDVDTCAEVVDLDGLTALRTLGSARVAFSGVRSIAGLAGVTSIAGDVDLISLPLGSLDGLAVTTIGGTLHLSELSSLRDLDPLAGLTEVGGLNVFNCYNLYDLTGLEGLTAVHGGVTLQANAQLIDLRGVESLRTIEGDLRVLSNPTMRSLDGLYIGDLGGALWIQDNGILDPDAPIIAGVIGGDVTLSADRMSTLRLLGEVTSIGGTLSTNEPITSTEALAVLEEVGGDVSFRDASTLVTLSFPALRSIGGSLRHTLRDRIATVSAPRLESVGGDLLLHVPGPYGYLPVPTTVTLDALRTVGGALDLWVTTFKDGGVSIPVLEEVGGDVTLDSNVARDHIDVLDGVVRIGGSFTLDARYTGTTAALTEVGGDLTIASDADTRAAMRAVTRVGGALIIDSVPDVSGSLRALTEVGALDVEPGAGFS